MVSIRTRKIKGKKYLYAEYSYRLQDGKVKKLSKYIKYLKQAKEKETKDYFLVKEASDFSKYARKIYVPDSILTKEKIEKIELMRIRYAQLIKNLTKKQMKDILDRFTANFTYESNAIEGNSLTLKDVTLLLEQNLIPKNGDIRDVYETRNTRIANEILFGHKIKINVPDILKLHKILVKDTGVSPGFKKMPNFLLMRQTKTTPPENVEKEINKLVNWYHKVKGSKHPIVIAAEFHGRFEKIHPFEDANGRIGRLLINAILVDNKYPPLIIRKTMRQSYLSALGAFDNNHKTTLIRFLIEKFERTFDEFFELYVKYL